MSLRLDWASQEAMEYACERWHYSKRIPKGKLAKLGVWEDDKFIGVVIFGHGAASALVRQYGLSMYQGCELVRIALCNHKSSVSRIVAIALRMLKKEFKGLRLVVSFADPSYGHHGGIYQAGNWIYSGETRSFPEYIYKGKRWHGRAFRRNYRGMEKNSNVKVVHGSQKYRYLYPLDNELRASIEKLAKPYPRAREVGDDRAHRYSGGATPTGALQIATKETA